MWRIAYDTADADHENNLKPYMYMDMIYRKVDSTLTQTKTKNVSLHSTDIEHIHLAIRIIFGMLTRMIFENKNKITTIIERKNDNDI